MIPPSLSGLPPFEENDHMAGLADRLTQVGFGWQHRILCGGKSDIIVCFDLHDFSHTHQNEGYDQVFNIALFWFPLRCCAVIQHDISCICVSYFPILCSQSAVPFLEGKKGESHNKAWLTRPPPVPLLSDNASMTSTLEGGPRRGGAHAMLVYIMKVTIQTWRGGSRTLISIGPGLQNIWWTSLDCCPLFPPFHCLATDNKLHRPPARRTLLSISPRSRTPETDSRQPAPWQTLLATVLFRLLKKVVAS